eukprot:6213000-Pleurochrysis_carterae.AAC.2
MAGGGRHTHKSGRCRRHLAMLASGDVRRTTGATYRYVCIRSIPGTHICMYIYGERIYYIRTCCPHSPLSWLLAVVTRTSKARLTVAAPQNSNQVLPQRLP